MTSLLLAAVKTAPPGDDFQTLALALLGVAMAVAFITTLIVTPGREEHH